MLFVSPIDDEALFVSYLLDRKWVVRQKFWLIAAELTHTYRQI